MRKVAVIGVKGRMGKAVSKLVTDTSDLELVAGLDIDDEINAESLKGAEVAVDFTAPERVEDNVLRVLDAGTDVVVGTSGWDDTAYRHVTERAEATGRSALIVPNFSLSAVFTMWVTAKAAPYFTSIEVIEKHHPRKADAPSGTAAATARGIAAARAAAASPAMPDATRIDPDHARGAVIEGVHVHAVRAAGLYAHQDVMLSNDGEVLTVSTDTFGTDAYMPGILLAIRTVADTPGLTIGLEKALNLG
ncbi:MAG: 4-hydroxy-tetrahydrodipicolinate reductase [Varibaculum sp.]|nr:4-hydroxy-tetrahydrodipicolinate reductase [Varibaculum sp.]